MPKTLNATMSLTGMEEAAQVLPEDLAPGAPRISHLRFTRTFTGDLDGKAVEYYCGNYRDDGGDDPKKATARFAGLTYFTGEIKGVGKGSIVLLGGGLWDPAKGANCDWETDPNSGTGDLAGLKAKGRHTGTPTCQDDPVTLEIQD